MPTYQLLTDRSLAQSSAITPTTLIHIVYTGDPSQNIAGSSYKAELGQLAGLFSGTSDTFVTGGTYSAGTITFINSSGGTFDVTGLTTGDTTTITGATSVGTGVTIFDSVIDRDIKINSITGDTLEKITTTLFSNTIEVGINEQNLDLWSLVVQGNRLISGGVSYVSGLTFETSALEYIIGGTIYDIPLPTTLVLSSGDPVFNRIDVIVADVSGNTSVVGGTPSANPEKPDIDEETQVEVTFVSIPANGTTPDIDLLLLYNENVGPPTEWSFGAVGLQPTRISGSSTDQTYSGLTAIRVSGVTGTFTTSFRLTGSTTVDTNQFATLQFAIRNLSANTTSSQIRLGFRTTGNTQNGNYVYMNAAGSSGYVQYSSTNTSSWQLISIPLWRFYLTNTNVQVLDVSFNSPNARYYFDMIQLVEGLASSPPTNAWTTIKGDGSTTIIAPNPNATLTISGGTNIGSFISGASTVVLNLDNNINLNGVTASTISATTYQNLPSSTFTGGTVSGTTNFTNGLSANTISATTYQNLPTDVRVTGGTYSAGTISFTNNTGGTFNVTGLTTGSTSTVSGNFLPLSGGTVTGGTIFQSGLTATTISATTYLNLPLDIRVTGGTYSAGTTTFTNNTGGTFNVTGFTTGSTSSVSGEYLPLSGGTVSGATNFTNGLTANTMSASTLFVNGVKITGDTYVTGLTFNTLNYNLTLGRNDGVTFTDNLGVLASDNTITGGTYNSLTGVGTFTNNTGGTFDVSGFLVGYTDVEVTGSTYNNNTFTFTNSTGGTFDVLFNTVTGLTSTGLVSSNTISATTYLNLPLDIRVTGGTYSAGTTTFTNNTGGTFNVTGFTTGTTSSVSGDYLPLSGGTVSGSTTFTNGLTANTISATTYLNISVPTLNQVLIEGNQTLGEDIVLNDMDSIINTGNTIGIQFKTGATMYQYATDNIDKTTEISLDKEFITLNATNNDDGYYATIQLDVSNNVMFEIVGDPALNNFSRTTRQLGVINDYVGNSTNTDYSSVNQKDDQISSIIVSGSSEVTKWKLNNNQISGSTTNGVNTTLISLTPNNFRVETDNNQNIFFVDGTNNRVGISTNTPTEKLTVSGNTNITGTLNIGTIGAGTPLINLGLDSSGNVVTGTTGGGTFTGGTVNGATNFTNGLTANTISATTYQNLPLDIRITGATYSNNTFTHRNNTGGTYTVLFNTVTGLTVNGQLSVTGNTSLRGLTATTISATTYQNLPTDIRITGATYSNNTFTHRNNTGGTYTVLFNTVTGLTINGNLTVTGSTNLKTLTATTTTINGNLTVTGSTFNFDGTTLDLKKNSTNPNLIISDTGNTLNDPYIRFVATSAGTPTYSMGVDKSASNSFNVSYRTDTSASPSNTGLYLQFTTGFTLNLPTISNSPTLALGLSGMTFIIASNAAQLKIFDGSSRNRNIEFTQYATYGTWLANNGGSAGSQHFILNNVTSGETLFGGLQKSDEVSIFHSGRTEVDGGFGVLVRGNLKVTGTTSVGTVIGTGAALSRDATTGILAVVVSDERLKQNVEQIPNALNIVNNLRGVYYNWKDNEDFQSGDSSRQFGFIAQEVETYLPEAVILSGSKDYKTVKYSEITSVLVEAIKEQQQMIEDLKVEITNLKLRVTNLES